MGEDYKVTIDLHYGLEMFIFVCNLTKFLDYRGNLLMRLQNGLEIKKIICVSYTGLER